MLEELFASSDASTTISWLSALLTMGTAFVAGAVISLTYMKTCDRDRYSQSFALTMVLTPAVVGVIILLIGSNIARAFSLAGAFSIIRFRSAPGEPRDVAYVLFAMAAGLAAGTGFYGFAVLFAVAVCLVMLALHVTGFGRLATAGHTLRVTVPENVDPEVALEDVLEEFTASHTLRKVKTADLGSLYQVTYTVALRDGARRKEFLDAIRCRNGNLDISLVLSEQSPE
jgi:hypothetical protein